MRGNQTDRSQRTESSNISVHLETTHHHSYPRALSMPVTPTAICASRTRRGHPRRPTRVARNRTTVLSGHSRGQHLSQQNFLPPAAMGARGPVAPPRAAGWPAACLVPLRVCLTSRPTSVTHKAPLWQARRARRGLQGNGRLRRSGARARRALTPATALDDGSRRVTPAPHTQKTTRPGHS